MPKDSGQSWAIALGVALGRTINEVKDGRKFEEQEGLERFIHQRGRLWLRLEPQEDTTGSLGAAFAEVLIDYPTQGRGGEGRPA